MSRFILVIIFCTVCMGLHAQLDNKGVFGSPVMPGPQGVYIYNLDTSSYGGQSFVDRTCVVFREEKPGLGFKKIASIGFPSSARELEVRIGKEMLQPLLRERKLSSAADLFQQLKAGRFDTLGIFSTSPALLQAVGALFIDKKIIGPSPSVSYRLEFTYTGNVYRQFLVRLGDIRYTPMPIFKKYKSLVNDSSLMVTWYALQQVAPYASIYVNSGVGEKFNEASRQYIYLKRDTMFVTYSAPSRLGMRTLIYLRPTDLAGNPGISSDTVRLLSLRFDDRIAVRHLTATDTLGAVWLKWDSMPRAAWCSGIEILKSRFATTDYTIIDTLPVTAMGYCDRNSISGNVYYYQVRPILYDLPQKGNITPAVVNVSTRPGFRKMICPQGLRIAATKDANIRLSWLPNADLDIFAYYILRGTAKNHMEVISPALRDTVFVDTIKNIATGITYLYAVAAMNMSMQWSDTSDPVAIQSPLARLVTSPAGIQGRWTAQGVRLQWNDVSAADPSVTGYLLYRRKKGDSYFVQLKASPQQGTYFIDSSMLGMGTYEYGCSSVDAWNHVSLLSPLASVTIETQGGLFPPAGFFLRNATEGIEVVLPATVSTAASGLSANIRYILYRRLVTEKLFQKVGEWSGKQLVYTDKKVANGQLYAYALAMQLDKNESSKTSEKSIRRK